MDKEFSIVAVGMGMVLCFVLLEVIALVTGGCQKHPPKSDPELVQTRDT